MRPYVRREVDRIDPVKDVVKPVNTDAVAPPVPPVPTSDQPPPEATAEPRADDKQEQKGDSLEEWFKGSKVVDDEGNPYPLTPVGNDGLHFTDAGDDQGKQELNFNKLPEILRPAVLNILGDKIPPEPVQRLFLKTGNLSHLRIGEPEMIPEITDKISQLYQQGDRYILSIKNPLIPNRIIPIQSLEAMLETDPPLAQSLKSAGLAWNRIKGGDFLKTAQSIGRGRMLPDLLSRGGYDGIYSQEDGNQHWLPLKPDQVRPLN